MRLTPQQHAHFETFGFLVFRHLLAPDEIARYSLEFAAGHDAWLDGVPYDGQTRHYASLMEEASPFIAGLADDPRFADVSEQLLGKKSTRGGRSLPQASHDSDKVMGEFSVSIAGLQHLAPTLESLGSGAKRVTRKIRMPIIDHEHR